MVDWLFAAALRLPSAGISLHSVAPLPGGGSVAAVERFLRSVEPSGVRCLPKAARRVERRRQQFIRRPDVLQHLRR